MKRNTLTFSPYGCTLVFLWVQNPLLFSYSHRQQSISIYCECHSAGNLSWEDKFIEIYSPFAHFGSFNYYYKLET